MNSNDSTLTDESITIYAEKLKGYITKQSVREVHDAMKISAKLLEVANGTMKFLSDPIVADSIAKHCPAFFNVQKAAGLAKMLGPAGVALGTGADIMVAVGLIEDATMSKLNEISSQVEQLKSDVEKGFDSLKVELRKMQALHRFLNVYDELHKNVSNYERSLVCRSGIVDAGSFIKRLGLMVKDYTPNSIICDLHHMHALIVGKAGFGSDKPLFEQLEEGLNGLDGKDADQFIATLILQFQTVLGMQMRAICMLRAFVTYCREDEIFCEDMKSIFENLALQRKEYDPALKYGDYVRFMAVGGEVTMIPQKHPNTQVYMEKLPFYNMIEEKVLGIRAEAAFGRGNGAQRVLIIKPHHRHEGAFLISSRRWPDYYLYIMNTPLREIVARKGDPGSQGHWIFTAIDRQACVFTLSTRKWPKSYLCTMKIPVISDMFGGKLLGNVSDGSKTRAQFKIKFPIAKP